MPHILVSEWSCHCSCWWLSARLQYLHCWRTGDTAVLHWTIDVMLCNLFDVKPLLAPMLTHFQLHPRNKPQWNLNLYKFFFLENSSNDIVCKMLTVSFWPQFVKYSRVNLGGNSKRSIAMTIWLFVLIDIFYWQYLTTVSSIINHIQLPYLEIVTFSFKSIQRN